MLVKKYISEAEFIDAFLKSQYKNNYSIEWLRVLYEYLEESDFEFDLDIVAVACDWTEFNISDIEKYYWMDLETLKEHTQVLETENTAVILTF